MNASMKYDLSLLETMLKQRCKLAVLSILFSLIATMSLQAESFFQHFEIANKKFLSNSLEDKLAEIDSLNIEIKEAFNSTMTTKPSLGLHEILNFGASKEDILKDQIGSLIEFEADHRCRLTNWTNGDPEKDAFVQPLKLRRKLIESIKQNLQSDIWAFLTIHWFSIQQCLDSNYWDQYNTCENADGVTEILDDLVNGLGLKTDSWDFEDEDEAIKLYAFLYFLRKTSDPNCQEALIKFSVVTNTEVFKRLTPKAVNIQRAGKDYYEYSYFPPQTDKSLIDSELAEYWVAQCLWGGPTDQPSSSLKEFYGFKYWLFENVIEEMKRVDVNENSSPFWPIYSFLCRSYPCISAFKISDSIETKEYHFVDGYISEDSKSDRPAQRDFISSSPIGLAWQKYMKAAQSTDTKTVAENLFSPILLLQFKLSYEAAPNEFPYTDEKVGYKGYLDFYQSLLIEAHQ